MTAIRWLCLLVPLMLLMVTTSGCEKGTDSIPVPTRGPVVGQIGGSSAASILVSASTNCANPGDIVDFTLNINNRSDRDLKLTGDPLLEMIIRSPSDPNIPKQYWSKSSTYPTVIDPVLKPFEERTYHWKWKADAIYAPDILVRNGIILNAKAKIDIDNQSTPIEIDSFIGVGVKSFSSGEGVGNVAVLCRDMK